MEPWKRDDLPYDAMGDFSVFEFEKEDDPAHTEKETHIVKMRPRRCKCCSLPGIVFHQVRHLNNTSWPV